MAWSSTLTDAIRVSYKPIKERYYGFRPTEGTSRYRERTLWTAVDEYPNMLQAIAETSAAAMASDTQDLSGNRTQVTADVQRQNEAGAYKIVKTTTYTGVFGDWSAWA